MKVPKAAGKQRKGEKSGVTFTDKIAIHRKNSVFGAY